MNTSKEAWPFPTGGIDDIVDSPTEVATRQGVRFLHLNDPCNPTVACTVAYRPVKPYRNGKMLEIAVAYKHPRDTYIRKTGTLIAAERFLSGQTVVMPLRSRNNYTTLYNLRVTFLDSVQ